MRSNNERIMLADANNLAHLFCLRVRRTPHKVAFRYFDDNSQQWTDITWSQMADHVAQWQAALKQENLGPGDRVALMLDNSPQWVMFEQAAIGLGLVVVPLYTNDRAENIYHIVDDAEIKVFFIQTEEHWQRIKPGCKERPQLQRVICQASIQDNDEARLVSLENWLPDATQRYPLSELSLHKTSLATIVYTSGTTGKPKGVMLSHQNILWNADSGLDSVMAYEDDEFLSFLPLSHMFERTIGYYLVIFSASTINYARSIEQLAEDLLTVKPTVLITVPRIFERVYNKIKTQLSSKPPIARFLFKSTVNVGWYRFQKQQGKVGWHPKLLFWPLLNLLVAKKILNKLGGRMRVAVSGGAPLAAEVGRTFIGLGLTISQGYGMTETSPVVSTNKLDDNEPSSVGTALRDVEIKLGHLDELLVRSPGVMLGYWNNEQATQEIIDDDGWIHTGDIVKLKNKHIYITGRIKEILVLSNGEKVPPADIEMAISGYPLIEQIMVIGEQKPYLSAITVIDQAEWEKLAAEQGISDIEKNLNHPEINQQILKSINMLIRHFPGYANIYRVHNTLEPWTIENGLTTPTLKLKRHEIYNKFKAEIDNLYEGH